MKKFAFLLFTLPLYAQAPQSIRLVGPITVTGIDAGSISGNIPITKFNSGIGASSSTYWRGDGTWASVAGGGAVNLVTGVTGILPIVTGGTGATTAAGIWSNTLGGSGTIASPTFTGLAVTGASTLTEEIKLQNSSTPLNTLVITNATINPEYGVLNFAFDSSGIGYNDYNFKGANCRLSFENSNDSATGSFFMSYGTMQFAYKNYNILGLQQSGKVGSLVPSTAPFPNFRNLLDDGSGNASVAGTLTVTGATTLGTLTLSPAASATPASNGQLTFEATSNTSLTVKLRGSDGTVRSAVLTLAP